MFTEHQLGGVAEITSEAEAWAMAKHIAPSSPLSLRALFVALSEPLEQQQAELEQQAAPSSSSAAATLLEQR